MAIKKQSNTTTKCPRELSETELSLLRDALKDQLNIHPFNDTDHDDAEILLDYAIDMIEGYENVGHVMEELLFMEMSVCDKATADKIGVCLVDFFRALDNDGEDEAAAVVPSPPKMPAVPSWVKKPTPSPEVPQVESCTSVLTTRAATPVEEKEEEEAVAVAVTPEKEEEVGEKSDGDDKEEVVVEKSKDIAVTPKPNQPQPEPPQPTSSAMPPSDKQQEEVVDRLRSPSPTSYQVEVTTPTTTTSQPHAAGAAVVVKQQEVDDEKEVEEEPEVKEEPAVTPEPASSTTTPNHQLKMVDGRCLKAVEGNMASLNQRLSAYEGASSAKKKDDAANLTLEQRKASYTRNSTSSSSKAKNGVVDTSSLSLKDRMATYQKKQDESTTTIPSNLGKVPTLQDRMSKFGEGSANKKIDELKTRFKNNNSNEEETSTASPPPSLTTCRSKKTGSNSLKDRMAKFGGGSKPLPPNPIAPVIITPPKVKKTDHQLRMEKFHEATSSSGSLSVPVTPTVLLAKQTVKVGSLQDRMNMYKNNAAPSSQLDDFATLGMKKKLQLKKQKEEEEAAAAAAAAAKKTFKARTKVGSELQQRMSAFEKKSAVVKSPPPVEGQQTDENEPVAVEKSQVQSKDNQDATSKDTKENAVPPPKVSSVEQTKPDGDQESSIVVPNSLAELQNLVSAFAEVSSQPVVPDVPKPEPSTSPVSFQEDKLVEERDSPKSVSAFVGVSEELSETLEEAEEAAAAEEEAVNDEEDVGVKEEASVGVKEEEESTTVVLEDTTTEPDETVVNDTSNEVEHVLENEAKPEPEQVIKEDEEEGPVDVEEETPVDKVDEDKPNELVEDTPFEDEVKPNEEVAEAQEGEKKENAVSPTEYEYLYDLYVKFELLKSHPRNKILLEGGSNTLRQRDTDIKASVEGIIGGNTHYTANNRDWLNKDWIDKHINDGCFKFNNPSLFKTFDKTNEKSRDKIIRTFVKQLLRYANDITQLDLSSCLLPDKFLEDFAEAILRKPDVTFPNLQLINVESNELKGPGIEALSTVIANKSALRYLQVILLENQKHTMTSEAEKSLANAVSQSPSIVVCSVSIRCQFARKEINDAILYNTDQMRRARRDQQAKDGTLKERKRNDIELYFDSIASEECDVTDVEIVGDQQFLTLEDEEKIKAGKSFATNTSVKSIKMNLLGLNDSFAEALGNSLEQNNTIKKINIDSNAITGKGMIALFEGLGLNDSIEEVQVRHQHKPMSSADEECLPDLLASNTTIIKLGVDVRSQLVNMKLERIIAENRDQMRIARNAENKKNTSSKEDKKKLLKGLSFKPKSKSAKA